MGQHIIVSILIFLVAILMTMVGKGGGNFYVVILAMAGIPMHQAATTGQFILFAASIAAMVIFQKNKSVSWSLAVLIGGTTSIAALGGGYFSHLFSGFMLKLIFAFMLFAAGAVMLAPIKKETEGGVKNRFGTMKIKSVGQIYGVNLWIALPVTILTGFGSGMVGVSGGSFLVPLMVIACKIPMHMAVGTASTLIAATAFMGFSGHAIQGDFNPAWAVPLAIVTIAGGVIGGKFALKTKPRHLKKLFAYTNWLAALFMVTNAFHV
ncbi:sulfite exporter TauE/SafE family protein [Desulfobacula sp.]|uniref:sulfite exporter TauE/SafE family protein n=1 Tax=Desulfobacula sp. TaxID=2593537 RepID=UPI00262DDD83|nr:sulfite exporter TauE/SafE family protein [Desulfobacula sp.]